MRLHYIFTRAVIRDETNTTWLDFMKRPDLDGTIRADFVLSGESLHDEAGLGFPGRHDGPL